MNKYKIFFALLLSLAFFNTNAQTPQALIEQMIAKLDKQAIDAKFVVGLQADRISDPDIYRGDILMKGSSFHLSMQGLQVFYDGTTQWAYQENSNEVSITTPTSEDLAGINPLAIIKQFKKRCNIEFYDKEKKEDSYIIVFYPKEEKSEINKLLVTINKKDMLPTKIVLEASQGNVTTLVLSSIELRTNIAPNSFDGTNKFPQAIINDLR